MPGFFTQLQGRNIQSFLATPTRIYTTVYVYVYVYRYTAYTIYRQHGAKFCQVLSSLPCIRARPYHCISWADSTPTRIYTTLLHYKIYTTLRIFPPWLAATVSQSASCSRPLQLTRTSDLPCTGQPVNNLKSTYCFCAHMHEIMKYFLFTENQ